MFSIQCLVRWWWPFYLTSPIILDAFLLCIISPNYCKMAAWHDEMNHPLARVCLSSCSASHQFNTFGRYEKSLNLNQSPLSDKTTVHPARKCLFSRRAHMKTTTESAFVQGAKERLTSSIEWALKDRLKWSSRPWDDFGKWQLIILGKPCLIACSDILEGVQKWSLRQC